MRRIGNLAHQQRHERTAHDSHCPGLRTREPTS
jgi:hypothetical protein